MIFGFLTTSGTIYCSPVPRTVLPTTNYETTWWELERLKNIPDECRQSPFLQLPRTQRNTYSSLTTPSGAGRGR